jgi:glycine betaine catabolism B
LLKAYNYNSRGSNTKIESHIGLSLPIQRIPMSEDFVKVADTKDIQPSHMKEVQVDGENICVVNIEGKYYAISNICTHEGGPLADGTLEGFEVECPWHGSKFDVRTGEVMSPPASEPEPFDIGEVYNDPKGPIRHFTISSSPTEDFIMFSTRIRDSPYKRRLSTLEQGAKVKVRGPEGKFVLHEDYSKPAVFLSGGIGVTPFRTMIKYATDKQLPVKIIMFDSNRDRNNILFKQEFDYWASINKNLKIIYTISEEDQSGQASSLSTADNWKGEYGRIDKAMILKYLDADALKNSIFYICGPPGMLKAMQTLLQEELEIPRDRIRAEEFTGY